MFKEPTVILVGAGASVEFGLPSGADVFQKFVEYCKYHQQYRYSQGRVSTTVENHYFAKLLSVSSNSAVMKQMLDDAAPKIEFQFNTSIDEYLYDNPSLYPLGKLFSANCILHHCFKVEREMKAYKVNVHLKSHLVGKTRQKSWIASLVKLLTEGASSVEDLKNNQLTIVSFNYDTMFEEAVLSLLKNTEKFEEIENIDFLQILHVNGVFETENSYTETKTWHDAFSGKTRFANPSWQQTIVKNSQNIFMINEDVSEEVKSWRSQARKAISNAEKVYSIGFACAPENISLIGLEKTMNYDVVSPDFYALNYDGNISLQNRFNELGVRDSPINGSADKPMGCSHAAELGFFSQ